MQTRRSPSSPCRNVRVPSILQLPAVPWSDPFLRALAFRVLVFYLKNVLELFLNITEIWEIKIEYTCATGTANNLWDPDTSQYLPATFPRLCLLILLSSPDDWLLISFFLLPA